MDKNRNEKFFEILKDFRTGMLVDHCGERLTGRPMTIAQVEPNCDLWFFSADSTEKMDEIRANAHVLVTCQEEPGCYLSLSGTATISRDKSKIDELWSEPFRVWFPEGKEDPKLTLINVQAERGEYWDVRGIDRINYLFEAVKAYATGTTPDIKEGRQHGEVRF